MTHDADKVDYADITEATDDDNDNEDDDSKDNMLMTMETTYISIIHGNQRHALDCNRQVNIHAGIGQIRLCHQIAANFMILQKINFQIYSNHILYLIRVYVN